MRKNNDGRGRMGGRKAGTPNKPKAPLRVHLCALMEKYRKQMIEDFHSLTAAERLCFACSVLNYLSKQGDDNKEA